MRVPVEWVQASSIRHLEALLPEALQQMFRRPLGMRRPPVGQPGQNDRHTRPFVLLHKLLHTQVLRFKSFGWVAVGACHGKEEGVDDGEGAAVEGLVFGCILQGLHSLLERPTYPPAPSLQ